MAGRTSNVWSKLLIDVHIHGAFLWLQRQWLWDPDRKAVISWDSKYDIELHFQDRYISIKIVSTYVHEGLVDNKYLPI